MSYLKNKLKQKLSQYNRRKVKTNTKIKLQQPEARLIVNRSNKYIQWQVIDLSGKVIAMINDKKTSWGTKQENAKKAWLELAKALLKKKVDKVTFDRNGILYHGRIASFADGLREWGIKL